MRKKQNIKIKKPYTFLLGVYSSIKILIIASIIVASLISFVTYYHTKSYGGLITILLFPGLVFLFIFLIFISYNALYKKYLKKYKPYLSLKTNIKSLENVKQNLNAYVSNDTFDIIIRKDIKNFDVLAFYHFKHQFSLPKLVEQRRKNTSFIYRRFNEKSLSFTKFIKEIHVKVAILLFDEFTHDFRDVLPKKDNFADADMYLLYNIKSGTLYMRFLNPKTLELDSVKYFDKIINMISKNLGVYEIIPLD